MSVTTGPVFRFLALVVDGHHRDVVFSGRNNTFWKNHLGANQNAEECLRGLLQVKMEVVLAVEIDKIKDVLFSARVTVAVIP